jgi:transketolase
MRKSFSEVASSVIRSNQNSVLLLGDIGVHSFREVISDHPDRAINMGILEQSMVGIGAGFALQGYIPIIHTIAPFIVERAYEQIKIDFGYQNLPGNLVSVGASFDYAALGCTHHCPGDISILSNIPGINIYIPGTALEFEQLFNSNWNNGELNYFRLSESVNAKSFDVDKCGARIKSGNLATVIAVGPILERVLQATVDLDVDVIYINQLGPNEISLNGLPINCGKLVIVEPYYAGPVLQRMSKYLESSMHRVLQIGIPRSFLTNYGKTEEHYSALGFDSKQLSQRISSFMHE